MTSEAKTPEVLPGNMRIPVNIVEIIDNRIKDRQLRVALFKRHQTRTKLTVWGFDDISAAFTDIYTLAAVVDMADSAVTARLRFMADVLTKIQASRSSYLQTETLNEVNQAFSEFTARHDKLFEILRKKLGKELLEEIQEEWDIACAAERR